MCLFIFSLSVLYSLIKVCCQLVCNFLIRIFNNSTELIINFFPFFIDYFTLLLQRSAPRFCDYLSSSHVSISSQLCSLLHRVSHHHAWVSLFIDLAVITNRLLLGDYSVVSISVRCTIFNLNLEREAIDLFKAEIV